MQARRILVVLVGAFLACAGAAACSSILGDLPAGKLVDGGASDVATSDGTSDDGGMDTGNDGAPAADSSHPTDSSMPTPDGPGGDSPVDAGDPVVQVAAGGDATCAVTASGALYCWGINTYGEVGDGTTTTRTSAVHIKTDVTGGTLGPVANVSVGAYFTCAALRDNTVYCWGNDDTGELGDAVQIPGADAGVYDRHRPQRVPGVTASAVYAGFAHACVPGASSYTCWGSNGYGELGHLPGQMGDQAVTNLFFNYANSTPLVGPSIGSSTTASLGLTFGCANDTTAQDTQCWGNDSQGQLGQGQPEAGVQYSPNPTPGPVMVSGNGTLGDYQEVAASALFHACAIDGRGDLHCWGSAGAGQLGPTVGVTSNAFSYATMVMASVSHVSVGVFSTCVVDATQKVLCWGGNGQGQLGHDPATDPIQSCPDNGQPCNPNPSTVMLSGAPFSPVRSIAVGFGDTCAIKTDGTVWCWGTLGSGVAGTNDAGMVFAPTQVTGLP